MHGKLTIDTKLYYIISYICFVHILGEIKKIDYHPFFNSKILSSHLGFIFMFWL